MNRILLKIKLLSLLLSALVFWHYEGVWLYPHTRAQAASFSPTPANQLQDLGFDSLLSQLKEVVSQGARKTKLAPEKGFANLSRLIELKEKLDAANDKIQKRFDQLQDSLTRKGFPDDIRNRHEQSAREYASKYETLMTHLQEIESSHNAATGLVAKLTGRNKSVDWDGVITRTLTFLESHSSHPIRRHFDPKNLPHRSLKADKPVLPKVTREEWLNAFAADSDAKVNSAAQSSSTNSKRSIGLLAAAPPGPVDLAETIEVTFTPEIRQLADSLGRNPVRIFNWVRNSIEFVPTWGSIQGAQLCLETRGCNAADTASLLIALLRYSGIPARYQIGSVEVPIDKFKNWAGGFTDADAAASLFASGGVPSVVRRVNQSGQVISVRLEHVWVKAFVDYTPSGGAVNRQGDTWVELDAGFKQYVFSPGVDFEAAVPSNSQTFVNQLISTGTIDPTTGSVTNINLAPIQPFTEQLSDARISHAQANFPNARMRDLFGGKAVVARNPDVLAATAPYRTLARAGEVSQIPDNLRHKVTFTLGSNARALDSADLWSYTASLPELAGKNVLLIYAPATLMDEQVVRLSQDASSVPGLVNLTPKLYVGSEPVAMGRAVGIGRTVVLRIAFSSPTISTPIISNNLFAGEAAAIGLDLQGISPTQIEALGRKAQDVKNLLQQPQPRGFTNRDFAEAFLASNVMGWFATVDINNRLTSQDAGVVTLRYPSAGLFFMRLQPDSLFGVPTSVSMDGLNMDIDRDVVVSVAKDGDAAKTARLNFSQGAFGSAMEAELPSRLVSTSANPISGIGTTQALKLANDRGIPVYQINPSNAATIIPLLQIAPEDLADVQDALNAGLEVTVSRTPVSLNGRSLLGMVIKDPITGSANFLISGGTNGAIIIFFSAIMLAILIIGFFAGAIALALALAFIVGASFLIASIIQSLIFNTPTTQAEIVIGVVTAILFALMFVALLTAFALVAFYVAVAIVVFLMEIFLGRLNLSSAHSGAPMSFIAQNAEFILSQGLGFIFNRESLSVLKESAHEELNKAAHELLSVTSMTCGAGLQHMLALPAALLQTARSATHNEVVCF